MIDLLIGKIKSILWSLSILAVYVGVLYGRWLCMHELLK